MDSTEKDVTNDDIMGVEMSIVSVEAEIFLMNETDTINTEEKNI